ncbi:MAG: universal stress protein [Chloroflexi bacterium]|nr:universal stress protein [Chloroflexota bacterium]
MKPQLMIFTNGFEGTWPAIEYGAWIAKTMASRLALVGVVEGNDDEHPVEEIFSRAVTLFQEYGLDYSLELDNGSAEAAISRRANPESERMLVFGPFGRPQIRRMVLGNSFRQIMADVTIPILFVPAVRMPIKRVLICMGGLGYTVTAEHLGLRVAQMNSATVTLMTVIPPINLDYPEARKIRENWKNVENTDTLTGRNLREGLESAQKVGLEARIKVRHGNVVEQILAEVKDGNYDLICMGSQYSARSLRQHYTPNVTADVAEIGQCPILTARYLKPQE